jgi:dTDP-4-amino-4,6-dideoxygalactose transaminase
MLLPLRINRPNAAEIKREIVKALETLEIETRPVLTGNFLAQPAMRTIGLNTQKPEEFPVATSITETAFMVGAHHDLTLDQTNFLCSSLKKIAEDFC